MQPKINYIPSDCFQSQIIICTLEKLIIKEWYDFYFSYLFWIYLCINISHIIDMLVFESLVIP